MSSFVFNNTPLSTNKQDLYPLPPGAVSQTFMASADYNSVAQACIDLRTALKGWQGTVQTINYAALTTDYAIYCNATGLTITLPAGAVGLMYLIKDITGNASPNITIATTSSQTIDGSTTQTIAIPYGAVCVVWDVTSAAWRIEGQFFFNHQERGWSAITAGSGNTHEYLDVTLGTAFPAATGATGYTVETQISLTTGTDPGIVVEGIINKTTSGFRINFSGDFNGEVRWRAF